MIYQVMNDNKVLWDGENLHDYIADCHLANLRGDMEQEPNITSVIMLDDDFGQFEMEAGSVKALVKKLENACHFRAFVDEDSKRMEA